MAYSNSRRGKTMEILFCDRTRPRKIARYVESDNHAHYFRDLETGAEIKLWQWEVKTFYPVSRQQART